MCVDFTDVNIATPKDCFPLRSIDLIVDATVGFKVMRFMDAYLGYQQIRMHLRDEEKTSFIIEDETYCYTRIPFGLKSARATYQRLENRMFENQIEKKRCIWIT